MNEQQIARTGRKIWLLELHMLIFCCLLGGDMMALFMVFGFLLHTCESLLDIAIIHSPSVYLYHKLMVEREAGP